MENIFRKRSANSNEVLRKFGLVQRYTEAMRKLIPLLMAAVLGAPLLLSTPAVAQSARDIQRLEEQVNLAKARGDWNAAQNLEVQLNMARLQYQRNNGMGEVNDRYNNNGYWNGGNRAYYPPRNNGNWNNRNNGNWNNRRDRDRWDDRRRDRDRWDDRDRDRHRDRDRDRDRNRKRDRDRWDDD